MQIPFRQGCQIFFGHDTKTITTVPNVHKISQMAIKYINILQSKALQKLPKIGIFGLKSNRLATLLFATNNGV
jgi:hypothetical protein